jgi:hypothetical protein
MGDDQRWVRKALYTDYPTTHIRHVPWGRYAWHRTTGQAEMEEKCPAPGRERAFRADITRGDFKILAVGGPLPRRPEAGGERRAGVCCLSGG